MKQRVGLARALANDPEILLMDEAFSALDPIVRRDMQYELLNLQQKLQKTIVFITHDIQEAFKIGDRVAIMKDSKIVQIGTPEEILTMPANEYVEHFITGVDKTQVLSVRSIMHLPGCLVQLRDGPKLALQEMRLNGVSSAFVMDQSLQFKGIVNLQMAYKDGTVYVLEANPRSSRTIPFVSKAVGLPLAKIAANVMIGKSLREQGYTKEPKTPYVSVKEVLLPFDKLPGADVLLGPEMRSTGEVMGIDYNLGLAFFKAELSADNSLPLEGLVFISVKDDDKAAAAVAAKKLSEAGLKIIATDNTAEYLKRSGLDVKRVNKIFNGSPNVLDYMKRGEVRLIINTPTTKQSVKDGYQIRRSAVDYHVPYITTIQAAQAAADAILKARKDRVTIKALNEYHKEVYYS